MEDTGREECQGGQGQKRSSAARPASQEQAKEEISLTALRVLLRPCFLTPRQRCIPRKLAENPELCGRLVAASGHLGHSAPQIIEPRKVKNQERLQYRRRGDRIETQQCCAFFRLAAFQVCPAEQNWQAVIGSRGSSIVERFQGLDGSLVMLIREQGVSESDILHRPLRG